VKAVKPKRKVVRDRPERVLRPVPEPRTAFAGPFRRYAEPYASGYGRPFFNFGW
jgi:hypothetical protein